MYLWKVWRDTRSRLALYALAAVVVGVLLGMELIANVRYFAAWHAVSNHWTGRWDHLMEMTKWQVSQVADLGMKAALLAGLILGASSIGKEYGQGTMPFVLTRPSSRTKLVMTDWTMGLTALVLIVGGVAFAEFPFLAHVGAPGPGNILGVLPGLWVLAAAVYGLAHFTTLVAGSTSKGLILSVAAALSYDFLPGALRDWWHVDVLSRATDWTWRILDHFDYWPFGPFPWGPMAFWLALAGGFLAASLAWIRYREV